MTLPQAATQSDKIPELQTFRAIAIICVALFHFVSRWATTNEPNPYPWPKNELLIHLTSNLYLGVQYFFIISGFVIYMTLERNQKHKDFLKSRAKRLYPSLLLSLPIVFLVVTELKPSYFNFLRLKDLIPSILIIEPSILNFATGDNFRWTTGVLWSLWVEVNFYLFISFLYYKTNKNYLTSVLLTSGCFFTLTQVIFRTIDDFDQRYPLINAIFAIRTHIWWFIAGIGFYRVFKDQSDYNAKIMVICSMPINLTLQYLGSINNVGITKLDLLIRLLLITAMYFTFYLLAYRKIKRSIFRNRWLVMFGGLSYEFYLIHEAIGVSILYFLKQYQESPIYYLAIPVIIIFLSILSKLILEFSKILGKILKA